MDQFDRASEIEEKQRQWALNNQFQKSRSLKNSAQECQECGEPIPQARREAVSGCQYCIDCQEEIEKYGKTQFN